MSEVSEFANISEELALYLVVVTEFLEMEFPTGWYDQVMEYTELEQTKVQCNCLPGMWDGASVLLLGSMAFKFWSFLFAETLLCGSEANVFFHFLSTFRLFHGFFFNDSIIGIDSLDYNEKLHVAYEWLVLKDVGKHWLSIL